MFLPNISELHWSVTSTIQSICDAKTFVITNKFSETLSLSKVIEYTLLTRGAFLQDATITKTLHLPG